MPGIVVMTGPPFGFHSLRHNSRCRGVGCLLSPRSLTDVSSRGFIQLPPSCNTNYLAGKSASSFALQGRWLRLFTPVTYLSKLPGMPILAAFLQHE